MEFNNNHNRNGSLTILPIRLAQPMICLSNISSTRLNKIIVVLFFQQQKQYHQICKVLNY